MAKKDDNTQNSVKVCNHKPGDPWEEKGCCKDAEAIANQVQKNQIVTQNIGELTNQAENREISGALLH